MQNITVGYGDAATWGAVVPRNDPRRNKPELARECVMAILGGGCHADELVHSEFTLD